MIRHLFFTVIMLSAMLVLFANYTYGATTEEVKLIKLLDSIPDNEIAACKVKSNDFIFFCHLNKRTYYDCRVGLGFNFTLPSCEPVPCRDSTPTKVKPVDVTKPVPVANPFLDMLKRINK